MKKIISIFVLTTLISFVIVSNVVFASIENVTSGLNKLAKSLTSGIENATTGILNSLSNFTLFLKNTIMKFSEIASIILALIGIFLWFSGISPYSGRRMVISAALLFVFAYILKFI